MEDYRPILNALVAADVEFAIIGTWALKAYFPTAMADYVLHDCDLVLAPRPENVAAAFQVLKQAGWQVTVWGKAVEANELWEGIEGKYYARAVQGELTVDLTYECAIDWAEMAAATHHLDELPLAGVAHVFALKRMKARDAGNELEVRYLQARLMSSAEGKALS